MGRYGVPWALLRKRWVAQRSDIDIFVSAGNDEEANDKIRRIYKQICDLDGGRCAALRTRNSVTVCRDWPERHVQIVILYMRNITESLLFADLDVTAMAYCGGDVLTCSRSRRALRTGKSIVPDSMLLNRKDSPERIGMYMRRGFGVYSVADRRIDLGTAMELRARIQKAAAYEGSKLFDFLLLEFEDVDYVEVEKAVSWLLQANSSYSSWNIPRMPALTAFAIECFFERVELKARAAGNEASELVTALVRDELPRSLPKLQKCEKETWVSWGLLLGKE